MWLVSRKTGAQIECKPGDKILVAEPATFDVVDQLVYREGNVLADRIRTLRGKCKNKGHTLTHVLFNYIEHEALKHYLTESFGGLGRPSPGHPYSFLFMGVEVSFSGEVKLKSERIVVDLNA